MNNDELEQSIAHFGLDLFSEGIQAQVEDLLANGQTVEPDARTRLVSAAQRGLRQHAVEGSVFEVFAFETRKRSDLPADQLARNLGIDVATLREIENGRTPLRSLNPTSVAAWIATLGLEDDVALRSVRSSLRPRPLERAYASADEVDLLDDDAQAYFDEVRKALEQRRQAH